MGRSWWWWETLRIWWGVSIQDLDIWATGVWHAHVWVDILELPCSIASLANFQFHLLVCLNCEICFLGCLKTCEMWEEEWSVPDVLQLFNSEGKRTHSLLLDPSTWMRTISSFSLFPTRSRWPKHRSPFTKLFTDIPDIQRTTSQYFSSHGEHACPGYLSIAIFSALFLILLVYLSPEAFLQLIDSVGLK